MGFPGIDVLEGKKRKGWAGRVTSRGIPAVPCNVPGEDGFGSYHLPPTVNPTLRGRLLRGSESAPRLFHFVRLTPYLSQTGAPRPPPPPTFLSRERRMPAGPGKFGPLGQLNLHGPIAPRRP